MDFVSFVASGKEKSDGCRSGINCRFGGMKLRRHLWISSVNQELKRREGVNEEGPVMSKA